MTTKTRFAPSPTGYLHIGGARTALFSWLHARKHGGRFVLRIEDTDLERSTAESVDAILEGMSWMGIEYDEGPFYQTHRFDRYKEVISSLMEQGHAYHCYCSREELDAMRAEQMANKQKPRYDGRCRNRAEPVAGVNPVVRFKNPLEGEVRIKDLVRGEVVIKNSELDDLIIARSDGTPTYNLTVVVDDMEMEISHVIRGDDHLNNTPRQINILKALGKAQPAYAHVPMILGSDGKRLSKRHGAVSVMQYRDEGYFPEALLNYLVRLGWSHGDREIFALDELIELFDINKVNKSASTFNPEKLLWLNQHYIKNSTPEHVLHHLSWHLGNVGIDPTQGPDILKVIALLQDRAKTLVELAESCTYFYKDFDDYEESAAKKNFKGEALQVLTELRKGLSELAEWNAEAIHGVINAVGEKLDLKLGKIGPPFRVAITGGGVSPSIDATAELIGKERVMARLEKATSYLTAKA
ncbi:MAG: glutamate--tRNA ligase [Gammaproteobacteria bacterium]|nr:glutamate--tRNA ligase [Gammaproteobacteria bacterium]MDH5692093.1 glutamate--tRNA ligase [Gammaproteobacteria bacterium]